MPNEVSVTSSVSFKGIFNQSIYEQDSFYRANPKIASEKELAEKLYLQLHERKRERLKVVILNNASERIKQYQGVIDKGTGFWNYFMKPLFGMFLNLKGIEDTFVKMSKDDAKKELFKLAFEMRLLDEGLDKEAVMDLEKDYVVKKRVIRSAEIKDQIEKALLLTREDGIYLELVRKFIENALAMPNLYFKIDINLVGRIKDHDFFKNFEEGLQRQLEVIALKLAVDSSDTANTTSNRSIYYFHGDPGTGKSCAAKNLAEFLGLPFFEAPMRRMEDLSIDNLEGTERTMMTHNPGLFAKALMSKNKQGMPYLNAVLIIDDFDRLLLAGNTNNQIPSALSFLLDYLDPNKVQYFSPYFNSHIDISRLSIIITANKPIPKIKVDENVKEKEEKTVKEDSAIKEESAENDPYAALRSRVSEVHFKNFSQPTLLKMLSSFFDELVKKYGLDPAKYKDKQKEELIKTAIGTQEKHTKILEIRDLKRQLEVIVAKEKYKEKFGLVQAPIAAAPVSLAASPVVPTMPVMFSSMDAKKADPASSSPTIITAVGTNAQNASPIVTPVPTMALAARASAATSKMNASQPDAKTPTAPPKVSSPEPVATTPATVQKLNTKEATELTKNPPTKHTVTPKMGTKPSTYANTIAVPPSSLFSRFSGLAPMDYLKGGGIGKKSKVPKRSSIDKEILNQINAKEGKFENAI